MREFFTGWRRLMGCAVLGLACIVGMLWMRSCFLTEKAKFSIGDRQHELESSKSRFVWRSSSISGWIPLNRMVFNEYQELSVAYGPVVVLLTLLSAYLILWKPRTQPKGDRDA